MAALNRRSWNVFEDWKVPAQDWADLEAMSIPYERMLSAYQSEIEGWLTRWDEKLGHLGGDPTRRDWEAFRPLRLRREEDWVDWLAFLVETSKRGVFSRWVFGGHDDNPIRYATPEYVDREKLHGGHRCDLVVKWDDGLFAHMEVKIGDPSLEKTHDTGQKMRDLYEASTHEWSNFILLLSSQLHAWHSLQPKESDEPDIIDRTWEQVSIALRRGLRSGEDAIWNACAYIFVGAIEEVLIKYKRGSMLRADDKLQILEEGWSDEG